MGVLRVPSRERFFMPPVALPGVLWLLTFLILPLALMLAMTFWRSTLGGIQLTWTLENYARLFVHLVYAQLLLKSIRIALTVTAVVLLVAYPLAYWIAWGSPQRKSLALLLILIPFWTSYLVRTFAWYPLLGNAGIINTVLLAMRVVSRPLEIFLFNEFTVHLGLLYVYMPYATIPIFLSLDRLDRVLLDAAADLGASPSQQFWRIIFPLSLPGVLGGAIMVFVLCIGAYVTPQLLGGPSGIMIGNVIAELFGAGMNWPMGATLSVLMMLATLSWIWLIGRRVRIRQVFVEGQ
jgi:ABC-type spermidine/putrescine transport system permease subunit I